MRWYKWGGKAGSICHFAFSLVLQCLGDGKNSTKNVIVTPFLNASENKDLRAVSAYASRQSTGKTRQIDLILHIYRWALLLASKHADLKSFFFGGGGAPKIGNEKTKHIKKTHIKNFRGSQGRGSGREVSGSEFFMLVSFFPAKYSAYRILRGGSQGLGGGF